MPNSSTARVTIENRLGLHARPAMVFVETACKHKAEVKVRRCDQDEWVDGKSIMMMMMLAATQGTEIEIHAIDEEPGHSENAVKDLVALVKSKFQEE